jgi:hypothetical protein
MNWCGRTPEEGRPKPTWTCLVCTGLVPLRQRRPAELARVDYVAMWWHAGSSASDKNICVIKDLREKSQIQRLPRTNRPKVRLRKIRDDPRCPGRLEQVVDFGGSQREHRRPRRPSGANPSRSVLHHDAICRREPEQLRAPQIGIRIGLESLHICRRNELFRPRQSGHSNSHFGQRPRARGHDRPLIRRERLQDRENSRQRHDAVRVRNLPLFHFSIFFFVVAVREQFPQRHQTGAPVRLAHNFIRVEAILLCPSRPASRHGWRRIDQYSIQIKKNCSRVHFNRTRQGKNGPPRPDQVSHAFGDEFLRQRPFVNRFSRNQTQAHPPSVESGCAFQNGLLRLDLRAAIYPREGISVSP